MPKVHKRKIKKWVIREKDNEKGLIAFGGRLGKDMKIVFKVLEEGVDEHYTMKMKDDGSLDFHKTKEGKQKSYTPMMKGVFDFPKFVEDFVSILLEQLKTPINPKDQVYQNHVVMIPKSKEKLIEFYERFYITGNKLITPDKKTQKEISRTIEEYFIINYLTEIGRQSFSFAFVINPEKENINYIVNRNNAYYLVGIEDRDFERIAKKSLRIEWLKSKLDDD